MLAICDTGPICLRIFFSRSRTTHRADTTSLVLDDTFPPGFARLPSAAHRAPAAVILRVRLSRVPKRQCHHRPQHPAPQCGYFSYRPDTTLGLAQAAASANILHAELIARGALSPPSIFPALLLAVSRAKIMRLIDAFPGTSVNGVGKEKQCGEKR